MSDLWELSAGELAAGYRSGAFSPVDATAAVLDRIDRLNPSLNAFITVTADGAMEQARTAERAYRESDVQPPLLGVPVSIKDLTDTRGIRTTHGSLLTAEHVPGADAPVVERLRAAGAVILGKTSVPEVGWKGETTNRLIGSTHNPWRHGLTAGGSSGGAAAGVAAGLGPLAQGSDGAGSIRIPSSFCGVFGLKPTFGTVPLHPPSSTDLLSHVGPIARTVADATLMLAATAGGDPRDLHSLNRAPFRPPAVGADLAGVRVAWSEDLGYVRPDPVVAALAAATTARLTEAGADVAGAVGGLTDPWPALHAFWATAEAAAFPAGIEDVRDLIDPGRVAVIEAGYRMAGGDLAAALAARHRLHAEVEVLFGGAHLLATPSLPVTAFPVGLDSPVRAGVQTSYLGWTGFTYPFNLTGHPAATVPCGLTEDGLPVGLQLVGRHGRDALVLRAAACLEQIQPWLPGLLAMAGGLG